MLKKSIKLLTLLIGIMFFVFLLLSNSPIDPVQSYLGAEMMTIRPEQRENIAAYWGLHQSKLEQFLHWGKGVLQGDLGTSFIYRDNVSQIIADRFRASLILMMVAWIFSCVIGFVLGIIAGMKNGTLVDKIIKGYCFILASTPGFWLAILLLIIFSVWLGWFPVGLSTPAGMLAEDVTFLQRINHLFLPALSLSILGIAHIALHTRQKLVEVLERPFIRFARARGEKGLSLLWNHGLRHISLPALSLHFASFGELFGGAVLVEQVFSYPGLGQATIKAGLGGDIPLLLGIVLITSLFVFIGNLCADILYRIIDPRIRRGHV